MLLEDVEYFLEKSKAKECFDMLDLDKDGKVSLQVCTIFFAMSCNVLTSTGASSLPCHALCCADIHLC